MARPKKVLDGTETEQTADSFNEAAKAPGKKKFEYPVFNLWKVEVEHLTGEKDEKKGAAKQVKFTAVKIVRSNVKIETNVAESLNLQSHNNQRRYYLHGSIENGNEETVTIR